jgi:hypothetical protein
MMPRPTPLDLSIESLEKGRWQPAGHRASSAEFGEDLPSVRTLLRVLGQASFRQRPDLAVQPLDVGFMVDDTVEQGGWEPGPEWVSSRGCEYQHRTQTEDVARRADIAALGLLRRQIPRRSYPVAWPGKARVINSIRYPEVDNSRPILRQENV